MNPVAPPEHGTPHLPVDILGRALHAVDVRQVERRDGEYPGSGRQQQLPIRFVEAAVVLRKQNVSDTYRRDGGGQAHPFEPDTTQTHCVARKATQTGGRPAPYLLPACCVERDDCSRQSACQKPVEQGLAGPRGLKRRQQREPGDQRQHAHGETARRRGAARRRPNRASANTRRCCFEAAQRHSRSSRCGPAAGRRGEDVGRHARHSGL